MRIETPIYGDERTKRRFLLFPKKIDNEIRWLEVAKWKEVYRPHIRLFGWDACTWMECDGN